MKFLENITCHLLIDLLEWRLVTPLHVPAACQSGPVEATRPRNVESVSFFVCLTSGQKKKHGNTQLSNKDGAILF